MRRWIKPQSLVLLLIFLGSLSPVARVILEIFVTVDFFLGVITYKEPGLKEDLRIIGPPVSVPLYLSLQTLIALLCASLGWFFAAVMIIGSAFIYGLIYQPASLAKNAEI